MSASHPSRRATAASPALLALLCSLSLGSLGWGTVAGGSLGLAALAGLSGCGGPPIPFQLVFPSQETFLMSTVGSVDVFVPNEENTSDEICRNLSAGLAGGLQPESGTGPRDVCDIEGVPLANIPVGRLVFFADVSGGPERVSILRGCTVADVFANTTDPVRIQLSTLPTYPEGVTLSCTGMDDKCAGGDTSCVGPVTE